MKMLFRKFAVSFRKFSPVSFSQFVNQLDVSFGKFLGAVSFGKFW